MPIVFAYRAKRSATVLFRAADAPLARGPTPVQEAARPAERPRYRQGVSSDRGSGTSDWSVM
jgi:hypothetical protein